jgi:hypothetical protein
MMRVLLQVLAEFENGGSDSDNFTSSQGHRNRNLKPPDNHERDKHRR